MISLPSAHLDITENKTALPDLKEVGTQEGELAMVKAIIIYCLRSIEHLINSYINIPIYTIRASFVSVLDDCMAKKYLHSYRISYYKNNSLLIMLRCFNFKIKPNEYSFHVKLNKENGEIETNLMNVAESDFPFSTIKVDMYKSSETKKLQNKILELI